MNVPTVAVVLVNWNGWRDTIECLDSLMRLDYGGELIFVVSDNASKDDSISEIGKWMATRGCVQDSFLSPDPRVAKFSLVELEARRVVALVKNHENYGFAAANNIGVNVANFVKESDYYWILNNDTVVNLNSVKYLVKYMQEHPRVGICGASLLHYYEPTLVQTYGGVRYSPFSGRGWYVGEGAVFDHGKFVDVQEGADQHIDYVSGASMFVSKDFYQTVGPMSEEYFLYCEELDWALRARGGFLLGVERRAIVLHKEGAAIGTGSKKRSASAVSEYFLTKSKLRLTRKFYPFFLPSVVFFLLARLFRLLVTGNSAAARALFKALVGIKIYIPQEKGNG